MESTRQKQVLIACRYVSYDQWFLTHIDLSWKIKHLKQIIIAKALNLPFDRRCLNHDTDTKRAVSPITFAPDDNVRAASPIEFASSRDKRNWVRSGYPANELGHEGDNVANGWEDEDDVSWEDKGSSVTISTTSGRVDVPPGGPGTSPSQSGGPVPTGVVSMSSVTLREEREQIYSSAFTLVRFSTSQILEEDFPISWYDLGPRELVELHASSPPITFTFTLIFGQLLLNGGSITVDNPSAASKPSIHHATASPPYHSNTPPSPNNSIPFEGTSNYLGSLGNTSEVNTSQETLRITHSHSPILTCLPRHDPTAYAQPYWEGWVRMLRVVYRSDVDSPTATRAKDANTETAGELRSAISAQDQGAQEAERRRRGFDGQPTREKRLKPKKQWRDRWVVIKDGVLTMFKDRDDPVPAHRIPLSCLISIRDVEHLTTGVRKVPSRSTLSRPLTRTGKSNTDLHPLHTPTRRNADNGGIEIDTATLSSSSNQRLAPGTLSPLVVPIPSPGWTSSLGERLEPMSPSSTIIPPLSHFSSREMLLYPDHVLSQQDQDRRDRLRALECELERRQESKRREEKAELDKAAEFIMRWDDFSVPFGKVKDKGKDKDNRLDQYKEREKKAREKSKAHENPATTNRFMFDQEKDRDRGRERELDDQKEKERGNRRNCEAPNSDYRSYVPASREDAMVAGLRIVCALFKTVGRAEALERASASVRKQSTNTGPSLSARSELGSSVVVNESKRDVGVDDVERDRERKKAEWERFETETSGTKSQSFSENLLASRKSSLPGLTLGLGLLGAGGTSSASGTSRLGGLFGGKDKDKESNVKRSERKKEKEGRITSDKDRKATGKDEERDEDDNLGHTSSGRSFKLGKKKKDNNTPQKSESISVEKDWTGEAHPKLSQVQVHVQVEKESGARKPALSVNTGSQIDVVGASSPHPSPVFAQNLAQNLESDDDLPGQGHRRGYRHEERLNPQKSFEQQPAKSSGMQKTKKEVDKGEWVILDLGTDVAFNSFVRILHRHFPPPIQTNFIDLSSQSQLTDLEYASLDPNFTYPPSPNPAHNFASRRKTPTDALALPYPEWRKEVIYRARSEGMRESGRPLECILRDWGSPSEIMTLESKKQKIEYGPEKVTDSECKTQCDVTVKINQSEVEHDGGLNDPASNFRFQPSGDGTSDHHLGVSDSETCNSTKYGTDDNLANSLEEIVFDDSDEESESEFARWWRDIPRQLRVQGQQMGGDIKEKTSRTDLQSSPTSLTVVFNDPFTSSSVPESSVPSLSGSRMLAPSDHDLLRPSVSTTTLSSSRSAYSLASSAPSYPLQERHRFFEQRRKLDGFTPASAESSPALQRHISPEQDRLAQYPRRITSPSHTLSSPSSNESLESYSSQYMPSRPLSPDLHTQLSSMSLHQHMRSTSFIHQSASLPVASLPTSDHLTPPTISSSSSLKTATNEFTSSMPVERPNRILTPEQIHQIEAEVEAKMASASSVADADSSSRCETLPPDMSRYTLTPSYATVGRRHKFGHHSRLDSQSVFQNQQGQDGSEVWATGEGSVHQGGVEKTAFRKRTYDIGAGVSNTGGKKMEEPFQIGTHNTDHYLSRVPTDPLSGPAPSDGHGVVMDRAVSMSAEAILRRVRSGSSLQIPLGVHLEEDEGGNCVEKHA